MYIHACEFMRLLMFVRTQSVFFVIPIFKIDVKLSFNVTVWSINTNEDIFLNQNFFSATPSKLAMCASVRVSDSNKISLLYTYIHTHTFIRTYIYT